MGGARRSGRIAKEIAIVLLGTDTAGRVFSEDTTTVVLSRHGAGILSRYRPSPDESLTLRFRGGSAEVAVRLVGEMGQDARGYIYGVAFVDPDLDFWELKFPPPLSWTGGLDDTLECSACQTRDSVSQSEIEADVYALVGSILRFCPRCGMSTEWRRSSAGAKVLPPSTAGASRAVSQEELGHGQEITPEPAPEAVQGATRAVYAAESAELVDLRSVSTSVLPVASAPASSTLQPTLPPAVAASERKSNRRGHVRARVSFTACIRQAESEEIVECDNISKGGFSFRSRRTYAVDSVLQVAVPYWPGSPAIFVSAAIRHVQPLSIGSLFRYGAAYVRGDSRETQREKI